MTHARRGSQNHPDRQDHSVDVKATAPALPACGISNLSVDEERASQAYVPPRGTSDEPTWTRQVESAEGGELMARTVREVMTSPPTVLDAAERVSRAARAMRDGNIGDVLVAQDGRLVGILTDRDVAVRVVAEGRDPATTRLGDVCSREVRSLNPGAAIEQAVATMRDGAIRRLPIVEAGRPVGILSLGDLAIERDPHSALGEISAAPPTR